jgi:hypothetical protein
MRFLPALAFTVLAACDHHHHHHHEGDEAGVADTAARAACTAFEGVPAEVLTLGASPLAIPLDGRLHAVELGTATGRKLTLTTEQEHVTLAVFTDRRDLALSFDAAGETTALSTDVANGACPDAGLLDNRLHVHATGAHVLSIPDGATGQLQLFAIITDIGH